MSLPFVDHIFVINLPERADRRREIETQFNRVGWDLADQSVTFFPAIKPESAGPFPSIGAHGCFMSHLGVLRRARDQGLSAVAIFEDDLDFTADFAGQLKKITQALSQSDWKIFYGGHRDLNPPAGEEPVVQVKPDDYIQTAHFVCFKGEAIATLCDYLEEMLQRPAGDPAGGPMHVDGAYNWYRRAHPEELCLAANPVIGVQRASKSDIAPLRWFDRTPVVKNVVGFLRKLKRNRR